MTVLSLLAGFLSGLIGGMGLGGGAVLLIYLSAVCRTDQLVAQATNLVFFLPVAAISVFLYAKKGIIRLKTVLPMAVGGAAGAVLGSLFSNVLGGRITAKLFATVLLLMGGREVFCAIGLIKRKKYDTLKKE